MKITTRLILIFLLLLDQQLRAQVICNQCVIANPINNGLIACYPFSGNTQDQSGFNNHGTNHGATLTTDRFGNANSAYSFDGNSYILAPNSTSLSSPSSSITIAFWANTSAWSTWFGVNYGSVLSKSNSATTCHYRVSLIGTGISGILNNKIWDFFIGTNDLNKWDFFVVIMNGNTLNYYKNGVLIGQNSTPSAFSLSTNNPLYIGKDDPGFTDYYTGKIDDIRIYNRALSHSEVVTLYNFQHSLNADAGIDKSICIGDSVQLNGSGGPKYKWDNGTFLSNDSISNPFSRTTVTRNYILTVTDGLCEDKDTVLVTVLNKPLVIATGSTTICKGDSIQLNAFGANKYVWNNSSYLNNDTASSPIAKPTTSTSFIVSGFIGPCSNKDTVTINVTSLVPDAGLNKSICVGDSIQLNASGGTAYQWLSNHTLSDTSINNPIAKPLTNTKYYVMVSNGICKKKLDSVEITVTNFLVTTAGKDTSLCKNDSIQLLGTGGTSFVWSPSAGLSQSNIPNPIAKPQSTTRYILKSTSGNCTAEDTILLTVHEPPILDLGLNKTVCKDDSIQVNSLTNADKFTWTPTTFLNNSLVKNPVIVPKNNIAYFVKAESSQTTCYSYDTLAVNVNEPIANFNASTKSGLNPLPVIFNNRSVPLNATYFWDFGNLETSDQLNPEILYIKAGRYQVKLLIIDSIGCQDSAFTEIIVFDSLILTIPNVFTPNGDDINDLFNIVISDTNQISAIRSTIWNRWGGLVYESDDIYGKGWDGTYMGKDCSDGVYVYVFNITTNNNKSFKLNGTVTLLR
jgi:gliding motility-associated-like protein